MSGQAYPRGHPEADIQRDVVQALRMALPRGSIVHASNNEIRGSSDWAKRQQAFMKSMGQYPGFPDLIVMSDRRVLFMEVKAPGGRCSQAQQEFASRVEGVHGHGFAVVRSVDEALAALADHNMTSSAIIR